MARSQTAVAPAKSKPHRPTRRVPKIAPVEVAEFNPAEHHDEIAVAAYLTWLEQRGAPRSPEENWLKAEQEVRARYLRS
jgi:Protein of unknown function (DUF2934)